MKYSKFFDEKPVGTCEKHGWEVPQHIQAQPQCPEGGSLAQKSAPISGYYPRTSALASGARSRQAQSINPTVRLLGSPVHGALDFPARLALGVNQNGGGINGDSKALGHLSVWVLDHPQMQMASLWRIGLPPKNPNLVWPSVAARVFCETGREAAHGPKGWPAPRVASQCKAKHQTRHSTR